MARRDAEARYHAFAHALISNGHNASKAAIAAGYAVAHAHVTGAQLLATPRVQEIIREIATPVLIEQGLTSERALIENARIALFDPRKLYNADGTEKAPHEWSDETASAVVPRSDLIASVHDKNRALDMAFKYLGLYERDNAQRAPNLAIQIVNDHMPR